MTEEERAAIYAAMDDDDEGDDEGNSTSRMSAIDFTDAFTTIMVNNEKVRIPTFAYVNRLEMRLAQQDRVIQRFERQFQRMATLLRNQRSNINIHGNRINDVVRDLDHKIDLRD